jgi:ABC-type multidrug transport system ATPase subunit
MEWYNVVKLDNNKVIIYVYDTSIDKNKYQDIPFLEQIIFPLLDYSLSYDNSISLRNFYQKPQSNRFLDFPNKSEKIIYLYDEHIETIRKIFQNFKELNEKNQWKIFEDFFHPRDICISFNMERFKSLGTGQSNNIAVSKYLRTVNEAENKIGLEFIQLLYSEWSETKNLSSQQLKRLEIFRKLDNKTYFNMFDNLCQKNHSKMIKKESLGTRNLYDIFQFELSNICKDEVDYLLQLSLSEIFTIDIIDENSKKFNELSFGEQQLLKILNIIYYLSTNNEDKKLLIFLDEIDIGFHPNWQKRVIQYILKLLTSLSPKKFNLLISSHSPFLLSDIPKENVIFLEKGKQVYPFGDNQQTFGANIHTLLSHGFFMRDGLMGEFAKSKINEIIDFFNSKNNIYQDNKEKLLKIINTIGEPFLKEKLLFMYNEKYPKTNEEKIVELESEITRLKNG